MDITDTTPAHIAATLRPDHHLHTDMAYTPPSRVGASTSRTYTLQTFCASTARPGFALEDLPVLAARTTCGSVRPAAQSSVGMARKSCGRAKSKRSCLRHPTTPTRVKAVERPPRARPQATRPAWVRSAMAIGSQWHRPWRHRRRWTAWPSADASKGFFRFRRCLRQLRLQSTCFVLYGFSLYFGGAGGDPRVARRHSTHGPHRHTDLRHVPIEILLYLNINGRTDTALQSTKHNLRQLVVGIF